NAEAADREREDRRQGGPGDRLETAPMARRGRRSRVLSVHYCRKTERLRSARAKVDGVIPAYRRPGAGRPMGHPQYRRDADVGEPGDGGDRKASAAPRLNMGVTMPTRSDLQCAERRIDLVAAMLAHLRGQRLTGRAAIYEGCGLDDYE